MNTVFSIDIQTEHEKKTISVVAQDVTTLDEEIDILTTSAYRGSYDPTRGTLFEALNNKGINVAELAYYPEIDLRKGNLVWLSDSIPCAGIPISRIGCIEMDYAGYGTEFYLDQEKLLSSLKSYFYMLDIAALSGVKMDTVALPLIGTGSQHIEANLILIPMINECVQFLRRNHAVRRICFIERSFTKADLITQTLKNSYSLFTQSGEQESGKNKPFVFISYSSKDRNIADNLCFKLESRGFRVWYAPRNVVTPYAASITKAIEQCTHFIVILSRNSMGSEHVLNEIDLAFQRIKDIKFRPLRIDTADLEASFKYYLSRQHWMDAVPPIEARIEEFVATFEEK